MFAYVATKNSKQHKTIPQRGTIDNAYQLLDLRAFGTSTKEMIRGFVHRWAYVKVSEDWNTLSLQRNCTALPIR